VSQVKTLQGDAKILGNDKYDLILANINKNILLTDMGAYANALHHAGLIYFSGFYLEDMEAIKKEANKKGLIFVRYASKNNWVIASFQKQ
jgi:ribosomal protein L11 methyltransferase